MSTFEEVIQTACQDTTVPGVVLAAGNSSGISLLLQLTHLLSGYSCTSAPPVSSINPLVINYNSTNPLSLRLPLLYQGLWLA